MVRRVQTPSRPVDHRRAGVAEQNEKARVEGKMLGGILNAGRGGHMGRAR